MNTKYSQNFIFILLFLLIIGLVGVFNYCIDPYNIKTVKSSNVILTYFPRDLYGTVLKLNKNQKYDYLVIGGSSGTMFDFPCKNKKVAVISIKEINQNQMKEMITFFLDLHPEVKTVMVSLDYIGLVISYDKHPIILKGKNITIEEIYRLYFSFDTTKRSLLKILKQLNSNNHISLISNVAYADTEDNNVKYSAFRYYPRRIYSIINNEYENFSREKAFYELNSIIEMLKKRHINIIFYTYPYNAKILSHIYESDFYNITEDAKKYIVDKVGYMYDMAFVNQYTSIELNEKNYIYKDVAHPDTFFGNVFYDYIFTDNKRTDIIIKLTPQNISKELNKERKLLEEYISMHKSEIEVYKQYNPLTNSEDANYTEYNNMKDMPEEIKLYLEKY